MKRWNWLAGAVLTLLVVACGEQGPALEQAVLPEPAVELPAEEGGAVVDAVPATETIVLDLSLPIDTVSSEPLAEAKAIELVELPDFFEGQGKKHRTSVTGGLIINEEQDRSLDIDSLDGARIDVQVSFD